VTDPKCRVLCVDDHRDTSEMLQMLLSEEDYEVHTAETMAEACEMAERTKYDLYVLDKRLPDGTGVELCETLMKLSPSVRGMARLNWTMTVLAARTAEWMASTEVPSEQKPWLSGGVALTRTASSRSAPDVNRCGTSERNTGT